MCTSFHGAFDVGSRDQTQGVWLVWQTLLLPEPDPQAPPNTSDVSSKPVSSYMLHQKGRDVKEKMSVNNCRFFLML